MRINQSVLISWGCALVALSVFGCDPPVDAGLQTQRAAIVNGRVARADELLSTVSLIDGSGFTFCTGTLVTPTHVITAAHCFEDQDGRALGLNEVAVGSNSLFALPVPAQQRHRSSRLIKHPQYAQGPISFEPSGIGQDNDIGVIVLADAVRDQAVTPVLPANRINELAARQTQITVSGYGVTDENNPANDRSGTLHIGETPYLDRSDFEMLAGGNGLVDTCNGDSGGPAYVTLGGQRYLVGVTSRAAHDSVGNCGDRGIYSLAPAYLDWMEGETGVDLGAPVVEPEPLPPEPEPLPPEPQPAPPPVEPEPQPMEPEPPLDPEPNEPAPVEHEAPGSQMADPCVAEALGSNGNCAVLCARVDPDCLGAPMLVDSRPARLRGGCLVTPGTRDGGVVWLLLAAIAGRYRRRRGSRHSPEHSPAPRVGRPCSAPKSGRRPRRSSR